MNEERYTRKEAVALSYDQNSSEAPKVVAKGKGKIAESIIDKQKNSTFLSKKIQVLSKF